MKILETLNTGGFGHPAKVQERVRELAEGDPVPVGARQVPDATPLQDWTGLGTAFVPPDEPEPDPEALQAEIERLQAKVETQADKLKEARAAAREEKE